ncbi:MAG: NAD-dependent epimerase/dehydratase family protein [Candidatus Zixiibacteriota bacterium]|nr:MAG: NAD-dependent epimerase/dehydratase family protein [candidate division Zixibacteria bacterium]
MNDFFNGKTILVTGATGLIGSYVTERLLQEGGTVRAYVRHAPKAQSLESLGAEIVVGDIADQSSVSRAVKGCQLVFHFAGVIGNKFKPRSYFDAVNVEGTRIVAEAASEEGIDGFVHTSTVGVYGLNAKADTDERSPHVPSRDPYCDTKLQAERIVRDLFHRRHLPCVIVQPSAVYGPGDETWTLYPIELMRTGRMVLVSGGRGLIQPIYITDLVDGILLAARHGRAGESYILSGSEVVTIREFFGYYAGLLNRGSIPSVPGWLALGLATLFECVSGVIHKPMPFTRCAVRGTMMHATYNIDKAVRELGFNPKMRLEQGMACVDEWLKDLGYVE